MLTIHLKFQLYTFRKGGLYSPLVVKSQNKMEVKKMQKSGCVQELDCVKEKTDPTLLEMLNDDSKKVVPVIIQTLDGFKKEDRRNVETLGGRVKDDLYIIDAFSADIPLSSIKLLVLNSRIKRIFHDGQVRAV